MKIQKCKLIFETLAQTDGRTNRHAQSNMPPQLLLGHKNRRHWNKNSYTQTFSMISFTKLLKRLLSTEQSGSQTKT